MKAKGREGVDDCYENSTVEAADYSNPLSYSNYRK